MATVVASQSLADSATLTSSAYQFDSASVILCTSTNGATPPAQGNQVVLQLSTDNINWTEVDRRWFPFGPSAVGYQVFELSNYGGNGAQPMGGSAIFAAWQYFRLVFGGNVGAAVTIAASTATSSAMAVAVVPLLGVAATTGGAVGSWVPPQGGTGIVVKRCVANITTKSTGAANLSVGVAANATTSGTNLIPATAVGSAAVVLDSITTQIIAATAAESGIQNLAIAMAAGGAVTFTGSATTVGLVGTAFIEYYQP